MVDVDLVHVMLTEQEFFIYVQLQITNTYFMKPDSHLVTYRSGY